MKLFLAGDTDHCGSVYIITEDLPKAIEVYKKDRGYYPETIRDLTADDDSVIFDEDLFVEWFCETPKV